MPEAHRTPATTALQRRLWRRAAALLAAVLLGASGSVALAAARWASITETSFQNLTLEQGLPNEITTAVAEDGVGFLWVGTLGGLVRWDGYRFRVFHSDPHTAGALPDNFIQTLHGDSAGRLWVGTSGAGIARFDADSERFVTYPVGANGLSHVSVHSIADDGSGGLWVGTDGGLDHLDPASGEIRREPLLAEGGAAVVNALLRDHLGNLWAGTTQGLLRRDAAARHFTLVGLPGQAQPQSLYEDSDGRVWIGTRHQGAFVIDRPGAVARPVQDRGSDAGALAQQQVMSIAETRRGEVWLGTVGQGIVAVDTASGETRRIRNVPSLPLSLPSDSVQGLYRDRSGLVWVAGGRGLSRHDPRQEAVLTMFGNLRRGVAAYTGTNVSWILPAPDGRIWLGTHRDGVEIVDPERGFVAALRPDAAHPETALPAESVLALERAGDGSVFIGTKRGLYRASADGRRVERVHVDGRDPGASTWALLADGSTLWIGGHTDGLWRMDLRSGHTVPAQRAPGQRLSDERIIVISRGAGKTLWVGTRFGLNRVDPDSGSVQHIVPDPSVADGLSAGFVTTLFTDRRQRLWVGTYGGGINLLTSLGERAHFRRLATAQGLPDDNVNALLEDDAGRLWVCTDNGLARVDEETLALQPLRRAEGVVFSTYWTGAAARTAQGELLFGGAGGMTIVRPQLLQPWTYKPPVVVTGLQVGARRVPVGLYARAGAAAQPIEVPATANSLGVEFSAIDYSAPERNRYAYRLEGFDNDWIDSDASRRLASYTNLPPGDYRLHLRGSNRNGDWGDGDRVLPLRVLPAWHQTLWFRSAAALGAVLLLLGVVNGRTRVLRLRQAELERKVGERTAELEAMSRALAEKTRILERTSITDPLTGLHNRRFLTERIEGEIGASLRRAAEPGAAARSPLDTDNVFFVIDIDHFKRVNDRHGHASGDAVLVQFAHRVQSVLRASDYLVRWGGEEFLAVARDTDRARAEELAERIRTVVAEAPFVADDGRLLAVTCSLGLACLPFVPAQPRELGWHDAVRLGDLALMAAKRSGRNAWVALYAGAAARTDGLLARALAAPQQALRSGEIVLTSNRPTDAVIEALLAYQAAGGASTAGAR